MNPGMLSPLFSSIKQGGAKSITMRGDVSSSSEDELMKGLCQLRNLYKL